MWMELELPQRTPPERGEPLAGTRGLRGWLQEIEALSDRDAVVRFVEGLQRLNRIELPRRQRLKCMELLRAPARRYIGGIVQRINTQRLPLDDLSYRNFHALLTLVRELALGYDIVADAFARDRKPSRGKLARAVERALFYRGETMVRCAPVHAPLPQVFWHDAHALYRMAEAHGAAERRIANDELVVAPRRQSPLDMYRRILLFGVTPTEGMRRGQAERLYHRLEEWCRSAGLSAQPPGGDDRTLFHVDLAAPETPQPGAPSGEPGDSVRVLDASAVLAEAERVLPDAPSQNDVLAADQVDEAALQRLIDSWSGRSERRGERAARSEAADVEASLKRIRERLIADASPAAATFSERRQATGSAATLALQTIERPDQVWQEAGQRRDLPGTWGEGEQARAKPAAPSRETPEEARNWALLDASSGGFRLRWEGGSSSPAAVGELVALRQTLPPKEGDGEAGTPRECWTLGVIRRIKMVDDRRFDAGVETLGRHPAPAVVRHEPANPHRKRDRRSEPAEPALMLPPMRSRDVPPTVLVPAQMFREGDVLELDLRERMLRVRLGPARENSSAFSRFELTAAPARGRGAGSTGRDG